MAAELAVGDDYRLARCAAADVIGMAYGSSATKGGLQEELAARTAKLLYGYKSDHIGLVIRQHLLIRATNFGPTDETGFSKTPDPKASNSCSTALDATGEAISDNWGYLRDVNLNGTDLSWIQLYRADMAGASLRYADLRNANLRCANLSGADFTAAKWGTADFHFADVTDARPPEFIEFAKSHGAFADMKDEQWLKWRNSGFPVDKGHVARESQPGSPCGESELGPAPLRR